MSNPSTPPTTNVDDSSSPGNGLTDILAGGCKHGDGTRYSIPDPWRQGRTAYGGLTAGLALASALDQLETDEPLPLLRSASINFVGPVTGDPLFKPKLLRRGRNVTSAYVEAIADEAVIASASLFFGTSRPSVIAQPVTAPHAPSPHDCAPFTPEAARHFVPRFFLNFDTRLIAGARPASGADEAYIRCWSRHVDPAARNSLVGFLTLADVLPPAALASTKQFGPISTMTWLLNILEAPHTEDGWFQVEVRQNAALDGYSSQSLRLWNSDGRLIGEALQSVALFF